MARGHRRLRGKDKEVWTLSYDAPRHPDGSRNQKHETFRGKAKKADARLRDIYTSIDNGTYQDPDLPPPEEEQLPPEDELPQIETVGQLLDRFFTDIVAVSKAELTYEGYKSVIKNHLKPKFGERPLKELTTQEIQHWVAEMQRQGAKPNTIRDRLCCLQASLKQAIAWDLIDHTPATNIKTPKPEDDRIKYMSEAQVSRLLTAAKGTLAELPIFIALQTGMRLGEIAGLWRENLNLETGYIRVEYQMSQTATYGIRYRVPKYNSGRWIKISKETAEFTKRYLDNQDKILQEQGITPQTNQVCRRPDGTLMTKRVLQIEAVKVFKEADLEEFTFHQLRHTHAVQLLKNGGKMRVLQRRLGHKSITTTINTYGHVTEEEAEDIADLAFDNIIPDIYHMETQDTSDRSEN